MKKDEILTALKLRFPKLNWEDTTTDGGGNKWFTFTSKDLDYLKLQVSCCVQGHAENKYMFYVLSSENEEEIDVYEGDENLDSVLEEALYDLRRGMESNAKLLGLSIAKNSKAKQD